MARDELAQRIRGAEADKGRAARQLREAERQCEASEAAAKELELAREAAAQRAAEADERLERNSRAHAMVTAQLAEATQQLSLSRSHAQHGATRAAFEWWARSHYKHKAQLAKTMIAWQHRSNSSPKKEPDPAQIERTAQLRAGLRLWSNWLATRSAVKAQRRLHEANLAGALRSANAYANERALEVAQMQAEVAQLQAEIERLKARAPHDSGGRPVRSTVASRGWRVPTSPDWSESFSKNVRKPSLHVHDGQVVRTPIQHTPGQYPAYSATTLALPYRVGQHRSDSGAWASRSLNGS